MNIKELFSEDLTTNLIYDYLNIKGIEDAEEYIKPTAKSMENPLNYPNMEKACDTLLNNLDKSIGILQDCDGDGLFSSVIIFRYLLQIADQRPKLFTHNAKVHGLDDEELISLILNSDIELLIIPDASSNDEKWHKLLKDNGITTICLDHHPCDKYSTEAIVVNNSMDGVINDKGSGACVTFKFCQLLDKKLGENRTKDMVELVWLSLMSDICDMTSMENRLFAHFGTKLKNKMTLRLVDEFKTERDELNNNFLSWKVVPKISAIIRSKNEILKRKLFMAFTYENDEDIEDVINGYKDIYEEQNNIVTEFIKDNIDNVNNESNVLFEPSHNIYPFYAGLVASKYSNAFNKPCILYRELEDCYSCSIRSKIPIKSTLKNSGLFIFVDGHDCACGGTFEKDKFDEIQEYLKDVEIELEDTEVIKAYDGLKSIPNFLYGYFNEYADLWGKGITEPHFYIENIRFNPKKDCKLVGKNENVIQIRLNGITLVYFNSNEEIRNKLQLDKDKTLFLNCICSLNLNEWNGKQYKQIIMTKDFEVNEIDIFG